MEARSRAFVLSWSTYASYYLGRKGFSVVKSTLAGELGLSAAALAAIDSVYLVTYALGQVPSGIAADHWGPRRLLILGLAGSALSCALFGFSSSAFALAACFGANGFAQATGWPGTTKMMADWTTPANRGRIMGIWSTCYQVGGVAATALAAFMLARAGWRAAFWIPAIWLACMAAVMFASSGARGTGTATAPEARALASAASRRVLSDPVLYGYGGCYFCIKLIRYSLLFWLPYYLNTALGFDAVESGYVSTGFEIGGVLGSVGLGQLSDRRPDSRVQLAACSLLGLAAALAVYASLRTESAFGQFAFLSLLGALLFGPDALVSGAAAQDAGGRHAAASAVGLVNGLGSAGAMLQGPVTVGMQRAFGWNALLLAFVGLSVVSALCLLLTPRPRALRA